MEDIIEKIKKLLALSTSSNEHEAALASQRANELLIKHNLSLTEVQGSDEIIEYESESGSRIPTWRKILFTNVAEYYFCNLFTKSILRQGKKTGKSLLLIGKKTNTEVARQMFSYLTAAIERMVKKQTSLKGRTALNSYRLGVVITLQERFKEMKEKAMREGIRSQNITCNALVVQDLYAQNQALIEQYLSGCKIGKGRSSASVIDPFALSVGKRDGHGISLNEQVEGQGTYSITR